MIAQELLSLYSTYFDISTSPACSFTSLLRTAGALHSPTSNVTVADVLDLCSVSLEDVTSPLHMQMSYDQFYSALPPIHALLAPPSAPHNVYEGRKKGFKRPPVVQPEGGEHTEQYKVHHVIHDLLLPLTHKSDDRKATR